MAKKSRNLKRSNSLTTATRPSSDFKSLNDNLNPNLKLKSVLNRFASVKTRTTRRRADLKRRRLLNQALFSQRFFRADRYGRRLLTTSFTKSNLSADFKHKFATVLYEKPIKEPVCIRRRARKEVLFALGLTAKGAGAKTHRWTQESQYSCK